MPFQRPAQAAPCFLVELGNGDKFLFDIGTGAAERLAALQIPYNYLNKVFLGEWSSNQQRGRSVPRRKRKRTAAEKRARRERKRKYETLFIKLIRLILNVLMTSPLKRVGHMNNLLKSPCGESI